MSLAAQSEQQRGSFDDLPLAQIFATFDEVYGGSGVGSDAERDTAFDA